MDDRWTDRLSDYLDGEMEGAERMALETHLAACRSCAVAVDELRAVIAAAASLEDAAPAGELWPRIEARLAPAARIVSIGPVAPVAPVAGVIPLAERRRRFSFTLPQLAAAGVALVALSSMVVWLVTGTPGSRASRGAPMVAAAPGASAGGAGPGASIPEPRQASGAATPSAASPGEVAPAETGTGRLASAGGEPAAGDARSPQGGRTARFIRAGAGSPELVAAREYDRAVSDMQRLLRSDRARLRPETVRALEKSLAEIDQAIADARRALARDPANVYLNDHLAESMRLKLELLRQATALAQS